MLLLGITTFQAAEQQRSEQTEVDAMVKYYLARQTVRRYFFSRLFHHFKGWKSNLIEALSNNAGIVLWNHWYYQFHHRRGTQEDLFRRRLQWDMVMLSDTLISSSNFFVWYRIVFFIYVVSWSKSLYLVSKNDARCLTDTMLGKWWANLKRFFKITICLKFITIVAFSWILRWCSITLQINGQPLTPMNGFRCKRLF